MKKIYFLLLTLILLSSVAFAQEQYNVVIDNQINPTEDNKNRSFLIAQKQINNVTLVSAEAIGLPLKSEKSIQLIISDIILKEISSIEFIDEKNDSFFLNSNNKLISSKNKWKEIKFYDTSNNIIGIVAFNLLFSK